MSGPNGAGCNSNYPRITISGQPSIESLSVWFLTGRCSLNCSAAVDALLSAPVTHTAAAAVNLALVLVNLTKHAPAALPFSRSFALCSCARTRSHSLTPSLSHALWLLHFYFKFFFTLCMWSGVVSNEHSVLRSIRLLCLHYVHTQTHTHVFMSVSPHGCNETASMRLHFAR